MSNKLDAYYDPSDGERYPHRWGYTDTRFEFEGVRVGVTVSVGVAEWQAHYEDPGDLLKAADDKMYEAKRNGRNQVCS